MPFVEFEICADVSAGIRAINVEFLIPYSLRSSLRDAQGILSL